MNKTKAALMLCMLGLAVPLPAAYMGSYQWLTATNPAYHWIQTQLWVNGYYQYTTTWQNAYTCNWNCNNYYDRFNDHWIYNYNTGRYEDVKYIYIPG